MYERWAHGKSPELEIPVREYLEKIGEESTCKKIKGKKENKEKTNKAETKEDKKSKIEHDTNRSRDCICVLKDL